MAVPLPMAPPLPKRVAVVDDSPAVCQSLRLLLGARGYVVTTFAGASDLLRDVLPGDFDCFVIDLKLDGPDGLDGFSLLLALRAKQVEEPAIMISGWELPSLEVSAREAGFAALVRKPMMDTSLVRVMHDLFAMP